MPPIQDDQTNQQSTNSSGREPVAYTPRADAEVMADLMQGIVPQETVESLRLANPDTSPAAARLKTDIQAIVTRLIERNNLDPQIYTPEVVISTQTHANAMISPNGEKSILMVTAGLLLSVRTEDELAGVIAHELAHRFLRQKANGAQQGEASKVEESLADITSLKFLEEAGYNPHAPIDLAHRMGEGFRIINIDDVRQADSFDEKLHLIKELADPHPSWPMRIREMEDAMVAYGRYRGVNPSVDRRQEPISNALQENAREIWGVYKSPIAEGLERSGYYDSSTAEQLRILTDLVRQNFPPFNQTSADRLEEISRRIRRQRVDFDNVEERLAFTELADSIMGPLEYGNKRLVFPSTSRIGNSIHDTLYPALEEVWATEHGISVEDARARGERIAVGRVADLQEAVTGFMNARTAEEAVLHAKSIVEISAKIDPDYSQRGNFEGFYPPTEAMVKSAISSNGQWSAPYRQHVEWFQQTQSEEMRQVLQAMSLDADPWAANIIGKKSRSHWERETGLHDIPTIPSDRGYKTTLGGFEDRNYVYLDVADRDATGNVLKVLEPIASFQPRKLDADASKADIARSNAADIPNREQYDRQMIAEADWSMLATDFKKFVSVYGPAVAPHASLAHGTYPFAEKFFYELDQILPNASDEYKKNVSDYMWVAFRDSEDGAHGLREKIVASFNSSQDWPYEGIEWPMRYPIDHPAIQFISREPGKSIVSDLSKIHFLEQTEGLLKPGMARFGEQFNLPMQDILNYPHAETVQILVDKVATGEYTGTAIAIEAERLAHQLGTQIPIEDAFVLDKFARVGSRAPAFGENSLEQDFKTLRRANYEHHLGNTNDVAKLVQDYRFASASGLFLESPDMRSAAQEKLGPALDALPLAERVNAMRDLLRSENVPVPYSNAIDYKYQDPNYEIYRLKLPYTGHIDDPIFRNSIVDGYSSALALELGQDDGSNTYQERARAVVADVNKYSSGITKFGILSQLAEKVNAQRELAYHIRDIYREQAVGQALAQHMSSIVGELHINEASRDPLLASLIVDYLSTPLTNTSHQELLDYTATKYDYSVKKSPSTVYQLQNYHKNFWSSSLEVRAAYLEKLVFPLESTVDQQKAIIRNLVNDTFPDTSGEQGRNNRYAREIVDAYLNTADVPERRLLTTAMLAAQMQESSAVKPSIGEKLHTVLSHLGPAGGKLMQAIHSNPQTPQEIKDALVKSKTMYDPPLRWDVVEAVEKAGMLTQGSPNHVAHIGKIAGAGSFGITVFNTTQDGQQVADTFLRQHAADRAEREFEMMHRAATDISTRLPELKSITTMVAEARRSAVVETDMGMARSQNAAAEASYHGIQTTVTHDGQTYLFTHKVAPLIESGETYKRVGIAQGAHFNDLPESTPQEIAYKTAAAKAIFATQLSLRASGALTDHDRHGGNVKIEGDTIMHFDFGAMAVEPLTAEDKAVTGKIIGQALRDVSIGRDFNDSLLKYMDEVKVSDRTRNYIEGMRKDILALGDYAHLISTPDIKAIAANVLLAPTVDPEINSAFQKTLGIAAPIARAMIKQQGNKAGITVTPPVFSSSANQVEIIPTIANGLSAEPATLSEFPLTIKPTAVTQPNASERLAVTNSDALNGVSFEEMVKDNSVWRLRNPQTGEGFYIKRANADEIAMTTRATNFNLPKDSPIILPQIAGTLDDLPLAIRTHLENLPADKSDAARGATNFLITREVPNGAGIVHPSLALRRDPVITDFADASMSALKGKPITAAEYDAFVDGVTRLNQAGIFHGDMLSSVFIQRDAEGRMQFHIIDFDPWDPTIGKDPLVDVNHITRARADLEAVGAVETTTPSPEPTRFELYQEGLIGKTYDYEMQRGEGLADALHRAKTIAIEKNSVVAFDFSATGFSNSDSVRINPESNVSRLQGDLLAREGWQVSANGQEARLPISNLSLAQDTLKSMTTDGPDIRIETIDGKPYFFSADPQFVNVIHQFQQGRQAETRLRLEREAKFEPYRSGPLSVIQSSGAAPELTVSVEPSPTLKPMSFAQLNPSENLVLPDAVNPKPLNVTIPDLLRDSPQSSSRKASLLATSAMTAPIIVSETGVEGASALRPIVIADSFPSVSDAPKPGSSAPRAGGLVHMSAGSGTGVALGGVFSALRYVDGGSMDTAKKVDEAARIAERRELLDGTVETAAGKGSEQLRAETLASRADIAGMAPDGGFLATVGASKIASKAAPGLASGLQGAVTNGARVLGPVSLLAAAGVTYAEMQAAKAAQDGRREAGALYGLLGGIAGGAGTGALAGAWGGPWGALIGGTGGAIAAGFLATEYGRRSQMGDQMQRDLDHQAQYAIDVSVERLREIRNSMMRGESLSDADKRDVRAIYVAMAEQHARLEVLYVPETDIDGQLRRDFQLNQTAKAMAFLEEPSANMLNLPRTSIQSAQVASSRLPALVEQINARDGELNWKQSLDQDRFGKKDGIVTVAEVVKAANEYGLDLYTLDKDGKGLQLNELLSALHAVGVDSHGVSAGRTFTPNSAPMIADSVHSSFTGRPGAVHLLETLDALHIPGLNGQQLRAVMDQYGISVAMLDLKAEGKINQGDVARAFLTNGVPKETLNGLADHIIKLVPRYREGAEVWPTNDARLEKLREELKEYSINSDANGEADASRWNQARDTALDYLVNGGTSDDARFKLTRFSVNIISTLEMEKIGMLQFMDTNRDGKIDADKEALPWLAKHKIQFSDTNGNNVIDVNEFAAGLPANVRAMIDIEKARQAEVKIPSPAPTATPAVAEAQPAPAPEEEISEIVVTASRKPQGRDR